MKELITEGHVYCGMPPLYKVSYKDKHEYVYSDREMPEAIERAGKVYELQRYKGLGEMNADQLRETTMNPARRNLMKITIDDAVEADKAITTWMGDEVEARKDYITRNANFNKVDELLTKNNDNND